MANTVNPVGIAIEAINTASEVILKVKKDLESLDASAKKSGSGLSNFSKSLSGLGGELRSVGTGLSLSLTAPIALLGKTMINQVGQIEQYKVSLDTMLGSVEEGSKLLNDLQQFAAKTPFTFPGVVSASKQLLAFGIEQDKLLGTLKALGDVAAGVSVPIEQIGLAYGQVRTANQLYGTELRQFVNAGVPLLQELAKQFGVTESEVKKMVEEGKVGFSDVETAFLNMTSEGGKFFNLMDTQSKTFLGIVSNIKDSFIRITGALLGFSTEAETFGEIIAGGPFDQLKTFAAGVLESMKGLSETIAGLSTETKNTIIGIAALTAALGPLLIAAGLVASAFATLLTGPGLVVGVFYALGVAAIALRNHLSEIANFLTSPFVIGLASATAAMILFNSTFRVAVLGNFITSLKALPAVFSTATAAIKAFGLAMNFSTGAVGLAVFALSAVITMAVKSTLAFKELQKETAALVANNNAAVVSLDALKESLIGVSGATTAPNLTATIEATQQYLDLQSKIAEQELLIESIRRGSITTTHTAAIQQYEDTLKQLELDRKSLAEYEDNLIKKGDAFRDAEGKIVTVAQKLSELRTKVDEDYAENAVELFEKKVIKADETGQKILNGDIQVSDEQVDLLEAYGITNEKILKQVLQTDVATAKSRLDIAKNLNITNGDLIAQLLDYKASASDQEVAIFSNGLVQQQAAMVHFDAELSKLLGPEVKNVIVNITTLLDGKSLADGGFLGRLGDFVAGDKADAVKEEMDSFAAELADITANTDAQLAALGQASSSLGGAGGAASDATKEVDKLNKSIEDLGGFTIKEGGKIVDTFSDYEDGVEKVKERIKDLTARHSDFLEASKGLSDFILSEIERTADANAGVVDSYDDVETKLDDVQTAVDDLKEVHDSFIEDAKEGLTEYEDKLADINAEYEELVKNTNESFSRDLVDGYTDAVSSQKEITDQLVDARKELSEAEGADQQQAAQERVDELEQQLSLTEDYISDFKALTNSTQDFTSDIASATDNVAKLQEEFDAAKAAGKNTADISERLTAAQQELFVLIGKQNIATDQYGQLQQSIADAQAEANLSAVEFQAYLAGQAIANAQKERDAKIQALEDVRLAQAAVASLNEKDLEAYITKLRETGKFSEDQIQKIKDIRDAVLQGDSAQIVDLGLTPDAQALIADAAANEAAYQTGLNNQLEILQTTKDQEEVIYADTYTELQAQQTAFEGFMTLSYDNLITKLKEVEQVAKDAFAAQQKVAGSATGTSSSGSTGGSTFASGGFTGAGMKDQVAGLVHKGEWVAPQWMVKSFQPMFAALERMRNNKMAGFAEGGFTSPLGNTVHQTIQNNNVFNDNADLDVFSRLIAFQLKTQQ